MSGVLLLSRGCLSSSESVAMPLKALAVVQTVRVERQHDDIALRAIRNTGRHLRSDGEEQIDDDTHAAAAEVPPLGGTGLTSRSARPSSGLNAPYATAQVRPRV